MSERVLIKDGAPIEPAAPAKAEIVGYAGQLELRSNGMKITAVTRDSRGDYSSLDQETDMPDVVSNGPSSVGKSTDVKPADASSNPPFPKTPDQFTSGTPRATASSNVNIPPKPPEPPKETPMKNTISVPVEKDSDKDVKIKTEPATDVNPQRPAEAKDYVHVEHYPGAIPLARYRGVCKGCGFQSHQPSEAEAKQIVEAHAAKHVLGR